MTGNPTKLFSLHTVLTLIALATLPISSSALNQDGGRVIQHATYAGKYQSFNITMERQLIDLGDGKFKLSAKANNFFASITESESFYWRDSKILPIKYEYKQKIFGVKKQRTTQFDREKHSARFSDGKKQKDIAIDSNTLGPMSYQLQLQLDLINSEDKLAYVFLKRGKLKHYQFSRINNEKNANQDIDNPILVRRTSDEKARQTDILFDIDQGFALAAIYHTDDGDTHSMSLVKERKYPPLINTPYAALSTKTK